MSHYPVKVRRADSTADHAHGMPEGKDTGGMLIKPQVNARAGFHTHLYEAHGKTYETLPAYDEPGHTHESEMGVSKGPKAVDVGPGKELAREDSAQERLQRRGREWHVVAADGYSLGSYRTRQDAEDRLASVAQSRAKFACVHGDADVRARVPKNWSEYQSEVRRLEQVMDISTSDAQNLVDEALDHAGFDPKTLKPKSGKAGPIPNPWKG